MQQFKEKQKQEGIEERFLYDYFAVTINQSLFDSENIKVVTDGVEYLGGAIGSKQYIGSVLSEKIQKWSEKIDILAKIATTEPHVAFAAFTARWQYFSRVIDIFP